ncbi:hypothetical protein CPB83DRAFT_434526 [Crepidotus variabilis]|uniref:Uncharacterized protein n=1 Tax=Crepidotus variabilis TaxID=179855 RepID=A0A9P6ED99_9AGAR|nr:hypothetical protein CPB83DRAFT_434526 [Crepidotus variabilis]
MDEGEFHYVVELDSDGQEMNSATKKNKRKRKRGSSSTPLSKPAKKPRPSKDSSSILDAKSKGKQRASEFEHVDSDQPQFGDANGGYELNALDDDFEFREPGPSFQRSPEQTLVENVSRARQATEPFPTQETLVDEGPSSHRVSAFNPISHSTSANRRHSAYTTRSPEGAIHVRSPTPPPPAQPRKSVESAASAYQQVRPVSPGANSPLLVEPPVIKPRPKPRPKKVVIRPVVEASPSLPRYEAPYRNTRSRSRSVEPSVQPPAKRRKAPKKKEPIQEESEPETVEERPETPQPELKLPTTETVEEEMDVENFLTNADDSNNSIQGGLVSERAASLETDDAQTRDDLFAAPLPLSIPQPPPLRAPSTVNRIRPQAALLAYEATRQRPRFSLPPPPRASVPLPKYTPEAQSRYGSRPRQSEPSPATFRLPEPRTPAYNAPRRAPSVSSDEPVPVPGTRASTIKKEKEDLEKHSPYRPPAGTRADMILRSM